MRFSTNFFSNITFCSTIFKLKHFIFLLSIFFYSFWKSTLSNMINFIWKSFKILPQNILSVIFEIITKNQVFPIVFHAYFYSLLIFFFVTNVTTNIFLYWRNKVTHPLKVHRQRLKSCIRIVDETKGNALSSRLHEMQTWRLIIHVSSINRHHVS